MTMNDDLRDEPTSRIIFESGMAFLRSHVALMKVCLLRLDFYNMHVN